MSKYWEDSSSTIFILLLLSLIVPVTGMLSSCSVSQKITFPLQLHYSDIDMNGWIQIEGLIDVIASVWQIPKWIKSM